MDSLTQQTDLFPPVEPNRTGVLDVGDGHSLYWEEAGNPDGPAVVFLHGGPGAGAGPQHRRFFDPGHWRIVLFDQRGAGRSKPHAAIEHNTTDHLVGDIERLRLHLGVERWLVFGGSWGALLALVYAIAHPERCTGLIVRGVFLGRKQETDWFLHGMGRVFPEAHRAFCEFLPEDERHDLLAGYMARLMDPDPAVNRPAARAWNAYENACSVLIPPYPGSDGGIPALHLARIEAHYFHHDMFIEDDFILGNIDRIRHLPGIIVQGRYDMICPIATADELARAWTGADFVIVPDAGHSAMEASIRRELVRATEAFKAGAPATRG